MKFAESGTMFLDFYRMEEVYESMETFGRGCLYCIIGVGVLMFLALITQSHINIPWFIALPLVALAFWLAAKKTDEKKNDIEEEDQV